MEGAVAAVAEISQEQNEFFDGGNAMTIAGSMRKQNSLLKDCAVLLISGLLVAVAFGTCLAVPQDQETFASPDEAVNTLVDALRAFDVKALSAIFGPGGKDVVSSGDPVADKTQSERFINLYEQKNKLEKANANKVVLYVGNEEWPFPIPIVKKDGAWQFDTNEGREEILARRIGKNELSVIQVCLAYVDAQREYALKDQNSDGLLTYSQKLRSDSGKKDGLYWKAKEGHEQSPLGPLVAAAHEQGYTTKRPEGKPVPYHGYYYRILKAQGKDALGGSYDYVVEGKMVGGFAMVAYPARYGSSGIMTFIVNHDGVVYQKDLGEHTEKVAPAMMLFNPDSFWEQAEQDSVKAK